MNQDRLNTISAALRAGREPSSIYEEAGMAAARYVAVAFMSIAITALAAVVATLAAVWAQWVVAKIAVTVGVFTVALAITSAVRFVYLVGSYSIRNRRTEQGDNK